MGTTLNVAARIAQIAISGACLAVVGLGLWSVIEDAISAEAKRLASVQKMLDEVQEMVGEVEKMLNELGPPPTYLM